MSQQHEDQFQWLHSSPVTQYTSRFSARLSDSPRTPAITGLGRRPPGINNARALSRSFSAPSAMYQQHAIQVDESGLLGTLVAGPSESENTYTPAAASSSATPTTTPTHNFSPYLPDSSPAKAGDDTGFFQDPAQPLPRPLLAPLTFYPALNLFTNPHTPSTTSSSPCAFSTPQGSPSLGQSRKRKYDENSSAHTVSASAREQPGPRKRKYLSGPEKLSLVLDYIYDELRWTLGEFLYALFDSPSNHDRSERHRAVVSAFLQGRAECTPAKVLDLWLKHKDGRISKGNAEYSRMYSTGPESFVTARQVRVALTSFAAQIITAKVVKEAEYAIRPQNGLHASRKKAASNASTSAGPKIVWADIGSSTLSRAGDIVRTHQPLLYSLLLAVSDRRQATVKSSDSAGSVTAIKRYRPAETVVTNVICSLDFSRSNRANLIPLSQGLLHFALSAPYDLYQYNSRIAFMPAYSSVLRTLEDLAKHEASVARAHGRDPGTVGTLWFDNVQNYHLQRDARVGRVNKIHIGIAGTYVEAPNAQVDALDLDDKHRRLLANDRATLSVPQLLRFIDMRHREVVGVLHWIRVLAHHVPELASYQKEVSLRFRTQGAKRRLPAQPSVVHPLATCAKNETVSTDLKDALVDFLGQLGQQPGDYHRRLFLCGGDGLTFEKMVQLKHYLQLHSDPLESLDILQPVLAPWHTLWTDISRVVESHWGPNLSPDPSTLSNSAAKIGRRTPSNLRKVDFDQGSELIRTVFEARVLDCWRLHFKATDLFAHFADLAHHQKLPPFEELEAAATKLYRAYCTQHAAERALDPVGNLPTDIEHPRTQEWKSAIPLGSRWQSPGQAPAQSEHSVRAPTEPEGSEACSAPPPASSSNNEEKNEAPPPFEGDRVLANSISFMCDALVVQEFIYAMAEGDVGRVYEAMKMMLFTFAGSPHSKYTSYLLEFLCILELESSPQLRHAILDSLLINLSGDPGRFAPADLIQEYFNRLLQAIAERKGVEYNDHFIRNIVSRNLHHLARLRDDLKAGIGLHTRSGRHSAPQVQPELRILLDLYRRSELHSRRPGRSYVDGSDLMRLTDFRKGLANLRGSKLARWIKETSYMRGMHSSSTSSKPSSSPEESDSESESSDTGEEELHSAQADDEPAGPALPSGGLPSTLTSFAIVEDTLVVQHLDPRTDATLLLQEAQDDSKAHGQDVDSESESIARGDMSDSDEC
ncbi:hypothetical protein FKP32DRAFT_1676294 [Trametes sanguinea]|nr:hypothetical protein FKP32DRAFT_1676294 [Trametes sanguinea]